MQSCTMIILREMAAAKINLYLHVTGKRADGFHELDSWVVFAEYGDRLEAMKSDELTLQVQGPFAKSVPPEQNSVLIAAHALRANYNVTEGAAITLHKNLPVAAGIGGGTADAAAALRLLSRLWNITPRENELASIAVTLGSDVMPCLRSTSLYMNGRGERITPGPDIENWYAVLVNPGVLLSTKDVFEALESHYSSAMRHPMAFANIAAGVQFLKQAKNDLETPAQGLQPLITHVLAALDVQQGCMLARMSGSGATCFGIYNTHENAQNAASILANAYPKWWVQETKLK